MPRNRLEWILIITGVAVFAAAPSLTDFVVAWFGG